MEIPFRADSLERFIFWVGAAALLVPTAYIPWFLYPYIFGRAVFFQLAVEAMAVAWIFLLIQRPERYRPRWHLLGKAMAVFVFIALLASLFGADPGRSVWGTELRMTGWFTWMPAFFDTFVGDYRRPSLASSFCNFLRGDWRNDLARIW